MHARQALAIAVSVVVTLAACSAAPAAPSSKGPIKIGVIESLQGTFATVGKDHQDGFNLYLDSINSSVAGRTLEVTFVDDTQKPDVGLAKAKQLVEANGVQFLAGVHFSPVCVALAQYAHDTGIPLLFTGNCPNQNLVVDPKAKADNVMRFSEFATQVQDPTADWMIKQGITKAITFTNESVGGLELSDAFASEYIKRGGTIVQELSAPIGTTDFGPYLAQLNQSADAIVLNIPGADAQRFAQLYANYAGKKAKLIGTLTSINAGYNIQQLKDLVVGVIGVDIYCECYDSPTNKKFLDAFHAKYPARVVSTDAAQGYAGAQIITAAIEKVNGNVEDKAAFLKALRGSTFETVKGPVKLDADNDVVQNVYVYQVVKSGSTYDKKLIQTYQAIGRTWDRTPKELALPFGTMKGKWTNMTKDQYDQLVK